jgi:competence protein ComEA
VAAGGALPGSDLVSLNLAQLLGDGEQVVVARAGSSGSSRTFGGGSSGGISSGESAGGGSSGPGTGSDGGPVDLNTADVTALDSLPGVGPVLAGRILDWRSAHGRFTSIDELDEVSGIGEKLLAQIRPHVEL